MPLASWTLFRMWWYTCYYTVKEHYRCLPEPDINRILLTRGILCHTVVINTTKCREEMSRAFTDSQSLRRIATNIRTTLSSAAAADAILTHQFLWSVKPTCGQRRSTVSMNSIFYEMIPWIGWTVLPMSCTKLVSVRCKIALWREISIVSYIVAGRL